MSELRSFGWGTVDNDGNPVADSMDRKDSADQFMKVLNSGQVSWATDGPYKVVQLFYKEDVPE
jgi:hypothetical protein